MKLWEKIKDFLYDSVDYIIMLTIIIAAVAIISWRLDLLFVNNGANSNLTKELESASNKENENPETNNNTENTDNIENKENTENTENTKDNEVATGTGENNKESTNDTVTDNNNTENTNDAKNTENEAISNENTADNNGKEKTNADNNTASTETTTAENKENTQAESNEEIKLFIPHDALPKKVGQILAEKGLVSSAEDFVKKTVEMKLDTKLKSGDFKIKKGLSLEQIVKIIANVK